MVNSSNRPLVLAVDGGQTSTLALLADYDGTSLAAGHGGPSNHYTEPGGPERLESALRYSAQEALALAGGRAADVTHGCLGMTGSFEQARIITQELFPAAQIDSLHDVITALAGASIAQPGVIVISGGGSIAYGRLDDGREARSSGWGYLLGDEGSGYWIGLEALRAAFRDFDGRGEATALTARIPARLGVADLLELHRKVYAHELSRGEIAGLAADVNEAARAGDAAAIALLARAGQELGAAALAVIDRLGQRETGLPVYHTGGVFRAGALIAAPFEQTIRHRSPGSVVRGAQFSPVVGALFLALKAAGVALTPAIVDQISRTLPAEAVLKRVERN